MNKEIKCKACGKRFKPEYSNQKSCSWECSQATIRELARSQMRALRRQRKENKARNKPCVICGFKTGSRLVYQGKKQYILCPNHAALVIQEGKTFEELK